MDKYRVDLLTKGATYHCKYKKELVILVNLFYSYDMPSNSYQKDKNGIYTIGRYYRQKDSIIGIRF